MGFEGDNIEPLFVGDMTFMDPIGLMRDVVFIARGGEFIDIDMGPPIFGVLMELVGECIGFMSGAACGFDEVCGGEENPLEEDPLFKRAKAFKGLETGGGC